MLSNLSLNEGKEGEEKKRANEENLINAKHLAAQLNAKSNVTALGSSLEEVRQLHRGRLLERIVMLGDFNVNSGKSLLAEAAKMSTRIDTVGVGPQKVTDASVTLHCDLIIKKDEQRSVRVDIKQTGLEGTTGTVQLYARHLGTIAGENFSDVVASPVGAPEVVEFSGENVSVSIPYLPTQAGRVRLEARLETDNNEALQENNLAARDVVIRDEAIKLLFAEYEPTWEWRFVKEVFHRDRLVGREGFRTYLHSADYGVRRTDDMFLPSLDMPRSEFFASDVIFLSDLPEEILTEDFQNRLIEYVRDFGGGLVVIVGPRFGTNALAKTKLAEILPVVLHSSQKILVDPFKLQLDVTATSEDFMNLGDNAIENEKAWANLGELHWYQPVARLHPQGTALASHPLDRCVDGETPQPIIATRRYGKGEVVYLGFNEMWRLRRIYGEKYYRQFWGQLMYRLGLSHALGAQKRFSVTTDREKYQVGEQVTIRAEAYNDNFELLEAKHLKGRLVYDDEDGNPKTVEIPLLATSNPSVFEATSPLFIEGEYRLLVDDPVKNESVEIVFNVEPVSIERRVATRNSEMQRELAEQTGGEAYELTDLSRLVENAKTSPIKEITYRYIPLWNTWLILGLVVGLFLLEWTIRKFADLI